MVHSCRFTSGIKAWLFSLGFTESTGCSFWKSATIHAVLLCDPGTVAEICAVVCGCKGDIMFFYPLAIPHLLATLQDMHTQD